MNYSLTGARTKTTLQKVNKNKKAEDYFPDKGTDKTPEKQLNGVKIGNLSEKEFKMIGQMTQDLGGKNGEGAINVYQRPRRSKE